MQLLKPICEGLLQLVALLPLFLLAGGSFRHGNKKMINVFCIVFLLNTFLTISLTIYLFTGQSWNWFGKTAGILLALLFILFTPFLTKKEMGLTIKVAQPQGTYCIVLAFLMLRLGIFLSTKSSGFRFDTETLLYQATMPGFSEELIFRGILLGLLNKVYPHKWNFLKTGFGWGLIITAVLFGLTHGLSLNKNWLPVFSSQKFLMTAGLGFVLGFVKEKSQSLLPAVLLHNCWNTLVYWGR